jgi:hypothetical protein
LWYFALASVQLSSEPDSADELELELEEEDEKLDSVDEEGLDPELVTLLSSLAKATFDFSFFVFNGLAVPSPSVPSGGVAVPEAVSAPTFSVGVGAGCSLDSMPPGGAGLWSELEELAHDSYSVICSCSEFGVARFQFRRCRGLRAFERDVRRAEQGIGVAHRGREKGLDQGRDPSLGP